MATFLYYVNLDERGEFYADVRDQEENTVFEIHGFDLFDDGFLRNKEDLAGLKSYLEQFGIMKADDELQHGQRLGPDSSCSWDSPSP